MTMANGLNNHLRFMFRVKYLKWKNRPGKTRNLIITSQVEIIKQKKQSATLSSLLTIRDTLKLFLQNSTLRTINGNGWSATPEKLFTTIIRIRFYTHNWIKSHQGWLRDLLRILCTKLQLMVKRKN